jgi:hypothetical protein
VNDFEVTVFDYLIVVYDEKLDVYLSYLSGCETSIWDRTKEGGKSKEPLVAIEQGHRGRCE